MVAARELPRNLAGRQLGRYEVLTQLASGGMAAVYVARALGVAGFERLVAIKVLHPHLAYEEEFVSMFLDEARLAARIRHPNVVPTLDISDTEGDGFFLVMQYIEGDHFGSLLGHAARGGERIPARATARIVLDALGGLGAAHELTDEFGDPLKLVHRDVSPHNVMVSIDGSAHLTDFGVAKAEKRLSSTRAGQFKGKLAYMAEQASTGFADQRSDLFSMGIILWEALTGRRLFRAENNAATLTKILHEAIPLPSELWDDLHAYDDLMAKVLHREADQRYQTADEFAAALEDAAAEHEGIAKPREVGEVMKRWLGERVADQNTRVREAMELLGRSDYSEAAIPIPMESSASNVTMSGRARPPSHNSAVVSLETLDSVELSSASDVLLLEAGDNTNKRKALVLATLIAAILLGALLAVILATPEPETPIVSAPQTNIEPPTTADPTTAATQTEVAGAGSDTPPTFVEGSELENDPELDPATDESTDDETDTPVARHNGRNHRTHMRHRERQETVMTPDVVVETTMTAIPTPMQTVMRPTGMNGDSSSMMNDLELNPYR